MSYRGLCERIHKRRLGWAWVRLRPSKALIGPPHRPESHAGPGAETMGSERLERGGSR